MTETTKRRPTIDDVAREAGVSRGTVSRVLNGGKWVSPPALEQVERAIKKTGYRRNPHARSLATAKAGSVGFLLPESHDRFFEDPNFSQLMRVAADALATHDMPLVLILAGTREEQRRAVEFMTGGHVGGALVVSSHQGRQDFIDDLIDARFPIIAGGIPLGYEKRVGYVSADDVEGAKHATRYLRESGRTRIAHITGPQDTSGGTGRLRGYREEMGDDIDERLIVGGDYSRASGEAAMRELLARDVDFDAVFAANDVMAAAAMRVLIDSGRSVPSQVAVMGFDDAPIASTVTPALTTMRQPFERIGEEMVRVLLDVINGKPAARIQLPTELVVRESA